MDVQSDEEINFSAVAVDASPEHIKYHLKKCNNNLRNALNEHFEGRCGPFLKQALNSTNPPIPPAGARLPDPQRRQRESSDNDDENNNTANQDDANHNNNNNMMMMMGGTNNNKKNEGKKKTTPAAKKTSSRGRKKKIVESSSSSEDETSSEEDEDDIVPTRASRGGRGRGRAAAATRGRGGGRGRGRPSKNANDDDDDDEASSSSSDEEDSNSDSEEEDTSSEEDDDSDDDDDDDSSSEETDQGDSSDDVGRGRRSRGRGRGAAAAARGGRGGRGRAAAAAALLDDDAAPAPAPKGKRAKNKKKKDSDEDEESSDQDNNNNNNNNLDPSALVRKPKPPKGVPTQETKDFINLCEIPFYSRQQARAAADTESAECRRSGEAFYSKANEAARFCQNWQGNYGHPLHILTPITATPQTLPFANILGFIPQADCPCLLPASESCSVQTRRRLVASGYANNQLAFYIPTDSDKADRYFKRKNPDPLRPGQVRYELKNAGANIMARFNSMIEARPLPREYQQSIEYQISWNDVQVRLVTEGGGRGGGHFPNLTKDAAKKLLPPSDVNNRRFSLTNYSSYAAAADNWKTTQFLVAPTDEMTRPFPHNHLAHQLHLRLRGCLVGAERLQGNNDDFANFASLSYRTCGTSRDEIWSRRFAAFSVAQLHMSNQIVENPSFSNIFNAIVPPHVIFNRIKEIQGMSAKDIFAKYDKEFTRAEIDITNIPVRPPGVTVDLYPHQRRTIAFMLERERRGLPDQLVASPPIPIPRDGLNPRGYSHFRFHVSSALGSVVAAAVGSPEEAEILRGGKHRGGCIADVVGMGKTLSVLSAIILNPPEDPRPKIVDADTPIRAGFRAARPVASEGERRFRESLSKKLRIKATLVIVPLTLVGQWEIEMAKRCPNLSIIRYHGTERKKYTYDEFAAADIVITTFETYRITLTQEFFWFKWYEAHNSGVGAHLLYNDWVSLNLPANASSYHGMKLFAYEGKQHKKSVLEKTGGPDKKTVFLSRLHFHRIIMDEFHKAGGLRADMPIVDSNFLWLVSGTPLDADISPALKRMGVLDYSFVSHDAVKFTTSASDDSIPQPLSGGIVGNHFYTEFSYDIHRQIAPVVPINFTGGTYSAPPTCAATYARFALLSRLMIRNNIDTCPELANVRVTETVITLRHTAEEKKKYEENLAAVQTQIQALRVRGRIQTHIMEIIRLLNELRKAAVDPFGVTITTQDALAIRGGAQFENDNSRRNIVLVPIAAFSHLVFPQLFRAPPKPPVAELKKSFPHVSKITTHDDLKDSLTDLNKTPPGLPSCVICLDDIQQPTVISCGHMLCRECLLALVQRGADTNCPICRKANAISDNTKKSLLTFPVPEVKEEEVDPDSPLQANPASPPAPASQVKLPTKIQKVCQIVQSEIANDPTSKFLIFTAFPSVISCLRQELARMAIGSVTIDASSTLTQRAKRIALFQDNSSYNVRVCIVSSRVGNMGLTLTAANHLIIVEPSSNIDVDTQILGRVKRLGQQRAVTCHRLHVEDTIEMPLYDLVKNRTVSLSAGGSDAAKKAVTDTILSLLYPQGVPAVENNAAAAMMMLGGFDDSDSEDLFADSDDDDYF